MKKDLRPKLQKVKDHFVLYKQMTAWECIKLYKETRLAARVFELKKVGWIIISEWKTSKQGTRFVNYVLLTQPK